ncbi:ATP-dependent DNA ligase [Solicola sp. PLA-1-18]|uniref:ATP-dependent DNA ligase n=1 Tax=Solicola sp. PLA-1-18 TaxID=3380532 RepID=UPI003B779723
MLLARLAACSEALASTSSRLAKRRLVAEVVAEATPDEVPLAVSYLSGSLLQRRTGVGWASLRDLPAPVDEPQLDVLEVDAAFDALSRFSGPGSSATRADAVRDLFARATASEQRYLVALVSGEVRQGALESVAQDAVAEAHGVAAPRVRRAAMLLGSTVEAARLLATEGPEALDAVRLQVGTPVSPMLAATAADPQAAADKAGLPALVDAKLDGIRVQVHRDGDSVRLWSRSLDELTDRLPEVVDVVRALPQQRLVLDGEVIAHRDDGTPEAFQVVASRTASQVDVAEARERTPVRLWVFDLLHLDGRDLMDEPLEVRVAEAGRVLPADLLVERRLVDDVDALREVFEDAVARGYEGVVVKRPDAPYAAGRRDSGWVKVKPRHTLDLAVVAAEWGHGRRTGVLSNLHLAARADDGDGWVMLGKTFKGLTDTVLAWQTEQLLAREVRRTAGTVHVDPPLVVEIAIDGLQDSTRYPGGVALRFARVLRYRDDLGLDDVDTLATVRALRGG